jgi:hypothetical protein
LQQIQVPILELASNLKGLARCGQVPQDPHEMQMKPLARVLEKKNQEMACICSFKPIIKQTAIQINRSNAQQLTHCFTII